MKQQHQPIKINKWLIPFSWIYGFVVSIRNNFFKWGIYKRKEYDIPIICVGNLSAGGTGKTPHTEYLIELLRKDYKVAILSRGYKRKELGFIIATTDSTSKQIGDEPFQIKTKFPDIIVAVDKDRCHGIEKLLKLDTPPDVIILDDGYQHRYVKPSYSVLLSDYNRPIYEDKLLPAGRLREPIKYQEHANQIIVTKCPADLQPIDLRIILHEINPYPYQNLSFTTFKYNKLKAVFVNDAQVNEMDLKAIKNKKVLLVTGIASPKMLLKKLNQYTKEIDIMQYPDHHSFSKKDVKDIKNRFNTISSENKIIIVTEKDAGRVLAVKNIDETIKPHIYYLPIQVYFLEDKQQEKFDQSILDHIKDMNKGNKQSL